MGGLPMRWVINYIRSLFCQHEWELIFDYKGLTGIGDVYYKKIYRCKKCGLVQRVRGGGWI